MSDVINRSGLLYIMRGPIRTEEDIQWCRDNLPKIADYIAQVEAERDRLEGWLLKIDGGDHPCTDERQLRQWAYEAVTLRKEKPSDE